MELQKRKQSRLKNYDYSMPGAYFITICTYSRKCILSQIVGAIPESPENKLTTYGKIVREIINQLPERFDVEIPKYVIMPNHIHMIVVIKNGGHCARAIPESPLRSKRSVISKMAGYLKMNASKQICLSYPEKPIWQRSYYDHIIRGEKDYQKIWEYIDTNVLQWQNDRFFSV